MTPPVLPLEDAVALAATGDIWLFRGRSFADRAIQTVTNSPVNHVGMAVAIDDLPPLLWHAELGKSLPDVWTGQRQRGVQLHPETIARFDGRAELVATTYQAMGLLPKRRPASYYDPGKFWSGDRIDLVAPFALTGEVPVA